MEKIYTNCPNCGATINEPVCPYCGTKLVSAIYRNKEEQEEAYKVEDQYLIQKNGLNGNPNLFLLLFGGIFFFVGFMLFSIFILIEDFKRMIFPILMPLLFMIIGASCLFFPIHSMIRVSKIKKNGEDITGTVRGYQRTSFMINNAPELAILIRTKESNPCLLRVNTHQTNRKYVLGQELKLKKYNEDYLLMK